MKKIVLLCSNGMSTSAMAKRMQDYADEIGYKAVISAHGVATAKSHEDADVIMLGPQIRFNLAKVKAEVPNTRVEVIDMSAYGMMDAKAVLEAAQSYIDL